MTLDVREFIRLYMDFSIPTTELCRRLLISNGSLHRLRVRHGLPLRPRRGCSERPVDPTPSEIRQRAAECRARRTIAERRRDESLGRVDWTIPAFAFNGRNCTFEGTA